MQVTAGLDILGQKWLECYGGTRRNIPQNREAVQSELPGKLRRQIKSLGSASFDVVLAQIDEYEDDSQAVKEDKMSGGDTRSRVKNKDIQAIHSLSLHPEPLTSRAGRWTSTLSRTGGVLGPYASAASSTGSRTGTLYSTDEE
ncbi:hypothetical protein AAG570_004255 [Ranatra chinensis]|uniref:Uncharacterized protein n=1 Tax=Ranatra chinensis TaxID=642074 RepID=A0ABD0Y3W8_9HEMI